MKSPITQKIPWRIQAGVYGAAAFSNTIPNLGWPVIPVWLWTLGVPDWLIGISIGCRHIGPMLFAIHGGALIDRLGARRVMIFLALVGAIVPLLYPIQPFIWLIIIFQIVSGLADALNWVGAQTYVSRVMKGDPKYTGRMSFCTRLGLLTGPACSGFAMDYFGPWGGFGCISIWSMGILFSVLFLPPDLDQGTDYKKLENGKLFSASQILPRFSDYLATFKLLIMPAILFVMAMAFLRLIGGGVQASFFSVHLKDIGISATTIGVLISINGAFGLIGSLATAPILRFIKPHTTLLIMVIVSIACIAITPILGNSLDFLLLFSGGRGFALAASLVILISMIAQYTSPEMQGKAMGLRVTVNQMAWFVAPIIMGFSAESFGRENSFYIMGLTTIAFIVFLGVWAKWRCAFDTGLKRKPKSSDNL